MTRGDMKTNIRYAIGLREPEEQPYIEQAIHQGIIDVLRRTSCFVQCIVADVPDDKNRIEFAAAGPSMKVLHILRGNTVLDRTIFPPLPGCFAQIGQILFFADAFAAGEQLQMYSVQRPPVMTDDTDLLEDEQWGGIPEEFQDAVELFACAKLASRSDDATSQMGTQYWIMYVGQDGQGGRISEIKRQINRMSGMTLGPARVRVTRGGMPWSSNSNGNGQVNAVGLIGPQNNMETELMNLLRSRPDLHPQVNDIINGEAA